MSVKVVEFKPMFSWDSPASTPALDIEKMLRLLDEYLWEHSAISIRMHPETQTLFEMWMKRLGQEMKIHVDNSEKVFWFLRKLIYVNDKVPHGQVHFYRGSNLYGRILGIIKSTTV